MEEKFKKELEAILNGAAVTNEKDKKKSEQIKSRKKKKRKLLKLKRIRSK